MITMKTPNQIGSNPIARAAGSSTGVMISTIDSASNTRPISRRIAATTMM